MNSAQRAFKKLTIILIVLSVLLGVGYLIFKPETPKCQNGIKDVGEDGVDCGGFCEKACPVPDKPEGVNDIRINWTQFVEDKANVYDFVASISNDNTSWGVQSVRYVFTYYDASGNKLGTREGTTFIMPRGDGSDQSIKYLIEENVESNIAINRVDLNLSNFVWKQAEGETAVANMNEDIIEIQDPKFEMNTALKSYAVTGRTKNTSIYDFKRVDVNAVIFGPEGQLLAAGKYDQWTMIAGDGWGIQILFPNLKGKVSDVASLDVKAETNVFDENNLMKDYRSNE